MTDPGIWRVASELAVLFGAAALISAGLLVLPHPLLVRHALARPNARSSHRQPTPQGGGIAVISATTLTVAGAATLAPTFSPTRFASPSCLRACNNNLGDASIGRSG